MQNFIENKSINIYNIEKVVDKGGKFMKNEEGITMVALTVTILIMAVLAGATFSIGGNIVKQARLQTLNTNMLLLQAKIKSIAEEASFNKNTDNYKGQKVSEVSSDKVNKLKENGIIDDVEKCYLLSQDDLNSLGLEKVKVEEIGRAHV